MKQNLKYSNQYSKFKEEHGSVTLFVLIAMIFFLIVTISIYVNSQSKLQAQNAEIEQIKKNYEKNNYSEYLENTYNDLTQNTTTIKFSFDGGEYAMPTTGKARIATKVSIENQNPNITITEIHYQWSKSSDEKPTTWAGTINNNDLVEKNDCEKTSYYLWIKTVDNNGVETITVSEPFVIKEANITFDYIKTITAPTLNVNINFDSILTTAYKSGIGNTVTSAKNNRKQLNVSNNIGKIGLEENNYIYAEATDVMGNLVYKTEEITNIDNEGPIINVNPDGGDYELVYEYI